MLAFTLFVSSLLVFIFPIEVVDSWTLFLAVLSVAAFIDLIIWKIWKKRFSSFSLQLSTSLFIFLELIANRERTEFPHFDIVPPIDYPLSHLCILLSVFFLLRDSLRIEGKYSFIFGWLTIFSGMIIYHLIIGLPSSTSFSLLPITIISFFHFILSLTQVSLSLLEQKTTKIILITLTSIVFLGLIDGYISFQRAKCGAHKIDIPLTFEQMLFTAEDPRFYLHRGIDLHRLRMAARETIRQKYYQRGGSTITMQYAKVCYLSHEKTILRKLRQIFHALVIELFSSKTEILSRYLSSIPFGGGIIGINTASSHYFNKSLPELNSDQSLQLVMTLFDPVAYNPLKPMSRKIRNRRAVIHSRYKRVYLNKQKNIDIDDKNK